MAESCANIEVNLDGEIFPENPEDFAGGGNSSERLVDSAIGAENEVSKKAKQPMKKPLGFGFRRTVQDDTEDSIPQEIFAGPNSFPEEHEEFASPGLHPGMVEAAEDIKPLKRGKAVISPPLSPLQPKPMSPTRSILSLFQKPVSPTTHQSYVYREESPQLLESDSDDDRSLEEAQTAEQLLGSTMRYAEEETGENFFALSRSPRDDAMQLGQRVATLPGDRERPIGRTPSLLLDDDDASIQSWASQATETSFIKVEKAEPGSFSPEYWGGIVASMSLDMDDAGSDVDRQPSHFVSPDAKSPPRNEKTQRTFVAPPPSRKWDNLRNTLEATEMGTSVDQRKKSKPHRVPKIGKNVLQKSVDGRAKDEGDAAKTHNEPRKTVVVVPRCKSTDEGDALRSATSLLRSLGSIRQVKSSDDYEDFRLALGPVPPVMVTPGDIPQVVDGPSDVRIRVEDLSKTTPTKPDRGVDNSMDATVASRDSDPESSIEESMEVLYIGDQKSWLGGRGHFKTEIQG